MVGPQTQNLLGEIWLRGAQQVLGLVSLGEGWTGDAGRKVTGSTASLGATSLPSGTLLIVSHPLLPLIQLQMPLMCYHGTDPTFSPIT